MIPSRRACLALLKRKGVPEHVIGHSVQVFRVAHCLTQLLNEHGETMDIELVEAASLLHDISKMDGLQTGKDHAIAGAELLRGLGYRQVADVVEHHVVLSRRPEEIDKVTEEELVNYSDKRVMHDHVVSLETRFEDLQKRYGKKPGSQAFIDTALKRAREIERKIFRNIAISPGDLAMHLGRHPKI
jgi:uncharacterized protein